MRMRTPHPHSVHCIVPPHVLEAIARNGSEHQRELAAATLSTDVALREARLQLRKLPATEVGTPSGATEQHRSIHNAGQGTELPGRLVRSEGDPATGDAAVDEAYQGLGATWDLYDVAFGRNSYDDEGAALIGVVHYRRDYANAFWDGAQMVFGDGDGELFNRFTIAVDVIGHELTHAVTGIESALDFSGQTGALNESLSDVFGSLVKQRSHGPPQLAEEADWVIGAGLFTEHVQGVGLRSMKAPGTAFDDPVLGKDPQPAHLDDYVDTSEDDGGVHINSGIPNHAFYLLATQLGGYAWERAGQIWYAAATDPELGPDSDFERFAQLTTDLASTRFGATEGQATRAAWNQVGLEPL